MSLYAYTASDPIYPPYLSINRVDVEGTVEITVRSPPKPDGRCGDQATMTMDWGELAHLVSALGRACEGEG
ncbi:MAG TPA: hypothetical protein VGS12_00670 [Caulobacteraceae bacterium]|nr:hypothetical protein [Caulobacteraceae bacterium]